MIMLLSLPTRCDTEVFEWTIGGVPLVAVDFLIETIFYQCARVVVSHFPNRPAKVECGTPADAADSGVDSASLPSMSHVALRHYAAYRLIR